MPAVRLRAHWSALLAVVVVVGAAVAIYRTEYGGASVDTSTIAEDIQIEQAAGDQHPAGTAVVAYVHGDDLESKELAVRFRDGARWKEPVRVASGPRVFSPQVRMIAPGRAVVVWFDATPGGGTDTTLRGALIDSAGTVRVAEQNLGPADLDRARIASTGAGAALITWLQVEHSPTDGSLSFTLHAARVADEEFSAPGLVGAVYQDYASAITRDGTAVVASRSDPAGNVSAVNVHEQSSGDAPWTRTRVSAVPASPPALAAQADGTVVMLWQAGGQIAAASRGPQGGWSTATTLRAPGATANIAPQLIATSTGVLAAWAFSEQGFIDSEGRTVIAEIDGPRVTASRVLPGGDADIGHPDVKVTGRLAGADRDGAWMIWPGRGILASYCDGSACSAQARVARAGSRDRRTVVAQFGHGDHPAVLWVDGGGALLEGRLTR